MDLSELFQSLSAEDLKNLQETAQKILGKPAEKEEERTEPPAQALLPANLELLSKMMRVAGMLSNEDNRVRFFTDLKPLLSEPRRKKADTAIMLLQLLRIQDVLKNEDREGKGE